MSIYDGLCDVGSAVNNRCPNPATNYSNQHAWCDKDRNGTPLGADTWPDVVARFEAKQRAVIETIETAERNGMFLLHDDAVVSPYEARQIIKNGWHAAFHPVNPQSYINAYQREAKEHMEAAAECRANAARIKQAMKRKGEAITMTAKGTDD